jgi:hypothetical protein
METNCKKRFLFISWLFCISLSKYQQFRKIYLGESCYFEAKTSLFDEKSPKMGNYVTEMETNCKKGFLFISWLFSISLSKYQKFRKMYSGESCYFEAKTSLFDEKSSKMGNYITEMKSNCKKRFLFISW